ncbi:MAG: aminopeptidase P family protein, partial [Muribaculaceae bacterium]|nr:aminopeptidase P family protein [Muribaculaceae bacterium]
MSEYLAEHWQLLRWLSGFSGSAGSLVVTSDRALLWTDSRYFLQAAQELDGTGVELMKDGLPGTPSIAAWLCDNLTAGSRTGIDGMLFSVTEANALRDQLQLHGIELDTFFDAADAVWTDRPALPEDKVFVHALEYAGEDTSSKLARIMDQVHASTADATFISALDEIAWTLNIRCSDVCHNPVATGFLYIDDMGARLLIDPAKISPETEAYFRQNGIKLLPYSDVKAFLSSLPADAKVLIEAGRTAIEIYNILGQRAFCGQSAVAMLKACKNSTQVAGIRKAMERDGAALVRAFIELEKIMDSGAIVTELDVDALLLKYRSQSDMFFDTSFGSIVGYGSHGAIVHYSADEYSNSILQKSSLLLVDSGAQYFDGTTDITRTIALGQPTEQERRDFTLVMKGHIALGTAVFPEGTCGMQLDALARQYLWKEGLSYLHGTGHGVGHFLNVHEGPQSIRLNYMPAPLTPGMITSNEP